MRSIFSLIHIFVFISTSASGRKINCEDNPKLEISHWIQSSNPDVWNNGSEIEGIEYNSTVYFIPKNVNIVALHCSANYPVHFEFEPLQTEKIFDQASLWNHMYMFTRTYRNSPNMNDPTTYKFGAVYILYGQSTSVTGNYICQSSEDPNVRNDLHIFWEDAAPTYLLNPGTSHITTTHNAHGEIILPCVVSVREANVDMSLWREEKVTKPGCEPVLTYVEFDASNVHYAYDPFKGYILNYLTKSSVEGSFKCATKETGDFIITEVISDPIDHQNYKEIINRYSLIYYDERESVLTCCSNSARPPKVLVLHCHDSVSCDSAQQLLETVDVDGNYFSSGEMNGNCSNHHIHRGTALQYRCTGDGIDVVRRIIFAIDERYPDGSQLYEVYSKYSEIRSENLMRIIPESLGDDFYSTNRSHLFHFFYPQYPEYNYDGEFYAGQNVSFRCDSSPYYFADGAKITVQSNSSNLALSIGLPEFEINDIAKTKSFYHSFYVQHGSVILDMNMISVTCHAPVWNSKSWVRKSFSFHVQESILPLIKGASEENIFRKPSNTELQRLECELIAGIPHPTLSWMRDGKEITSDSNVKIKSTNVSISLDIIVFGRDEQGRYICVASNLAGDYKKTFNVFFEEPLPRIATIIIVFLGLVVMTVIGIIVGRARGMLQWSSVSDLQQSPSVQETTEEKIAV